MSKIPNLANVSAEPARYRLTTPAISTAFPTSGGRSASATTPIRSGKEVTSWQDMFNYDGPVAWLDDPRAMIGIALHDPRLRPQYAPIPTQINEARDFLINNGKNVVAIAADDGQAMLERGDVDMTVEYSGDIFQVMADCDCDNIAYVIPEEGTNFWVDNLVIPKGAPNKALAEVFLDYILDPHVGADISNYTAYATPKSGGD